MSAYPVLINKDLLSYIADYNTDDGTQFVESFRTVGLTRRCITRLDAIITTTDTVNLVTKKGYLDILKVMLYRDKNQLILLATNRYILYEWDIFRSILCIASLNGHLHILEWLRETYSHTFKLYVDNKYDSSIPIAISSAAENGHIHVLEWFKKIKQNGESLVRV